MKPINISIIGNCSVGKTAIANAMIHMPFNEEYAPTVGASLVKVNYKGNLFYLWDTCGMEKYRSLAPVYFRGSMAAVLVFAVDDQKSFESLRYWMQFYRSTVGSANPVVIVANKTDVDNLVDTDTAREWASSVDCPFVCVSAKTGLGLDTVLDELLKLIPVQADEAPTVTKNHGKKCC